MDYQTNYLNTRLKQLNIMVSFGNDKIKKIETTRTLNTLINQVK